MSSLLVHPYSSRRFAHQASWYSFPNSPIRSRSRTTRKRAGWELPPLGALEAASRMIFRWASDIGRCGSRRRMARWVNIASPIGMSSSGGASMRIISMERVLGWLGTRRKFCTVA